MPEPVSDEVLVDRVRAGDEDAFVLLYERYFKRVHAFVGRRLRNRADAEETTQEVFINVFNSLESFRGDAPLAAWIFGLTRRTIASRFKRKRHATVPLEDEDQDRLSMSAPAPSPAEVYEYQELVQHIESAVRFRLTPEQRHLFELHHIEEQPISTIAQRLSKSENSIKSHLYRTRKILLAR